MEKLPPEVLMGVWQKGKSLDKACFEFCDAEYVKVYKDKSVSQKADLGIAVISRILEVNHAEDKLKENLAEKLITGDLIGLGFIPPIKPQDTPNMIPPHVWIAKSMHLSSSMLFGESIHFERIRIIKTSDLAKSETNKENMPDIPPKHESRGRPSVEKPLNQVYDKLKNAGKFDFSKNLKAHLEIIQACFTQMFPYDNEGEVQYSAVSKHLGERFKRDRQAYKSIK